MKTKSKKEMDAFYKRVEDPTNHSSERWDYLVASWIQHITRIMEEKKWVDDGSTYYTKLIEQLHDEFEAPIVDFVDWWLKNAPKEGEIEIVDETSFIAFDLMVKTWHPCTKESALFMFEEVMDDFEEIWQEQEDKMIQQIKDDGGWMEGDFVDIKHPDNWKRLEIAFKEFDMSQMKYRYDGKESEWIDVSKDLMKKPSLTEPKVWLKVLSEFCVQDEYSLKFDSGKLHDIVYRPNILLKKWFLPNAPSGKPSNPIYSKGRFYNKQRNQYTKYASHIRFSYQP